MQGTFHLPNGDKIRCASQRRYIAVSSTGDGRPYIVRRSDDLHRLRRECGAARFVLIDTVRKEVL